ncbi:ribonuclease III domain-containing protein [Usnea florida]
MASIAAKEATIEAVESIIQYKFNHSALLWEALQCPGSPDAKHPNGNKRLAIIGDTVLLLGLAEDWFKGNETIGDFNTIRQSISTNANLQRIGLELGLERFIGTHPSSLPTTMRAMSDSVEAILGAIYLDSGMEQVKDVMDALGLVPREIVRDGGVQEVIVID